MVLVPPPEAPTGIHKGWDQEATPKRRGSCALKENNCRPRALSYSSSLFLASQGFELQEYEMPWRSGEAKSCTDDVTVSCARFGVVSTPFVGVSLKVPGCGNSPGANPWIKP